MSRMCPLRCLTMSLIAARAQRNVPRRFVAMTSSISPEPMLISGPSRVIPALAMSTSTRARFCEIRLDLRLVAYVHLRAGGRTHLIARQRRDDCPGQIAGAASDDDVKWRGVGHQASSSSFWWMPPKPPLLKTITTSPGLSSGLSRATMAVASGS